MDNFSQIKRALTYIDAHLDEPLDTGSIAERFHFSPYYFHRMFSAVVGKTLAAHIRDRRLARACSLLATTERGVLDIGLECGFASAQSFARAFKGVCGLPPSEYRRQGLSPDVITVDEMIMKFTNRLRGGIILNPNIIKRGALIIAGVSGDGDKTGEVWSAFQNLCEHRPLTNSLSGNGYEIRIYDGETQTVHVGMAVADTPLDHAYSIFKLPASTYASFDVYVANGYESENSAMNEWLETNSGGYREKKLDGAHYCVEYYDERFSGSEAGSIVEIWIPVERE